MSYSAAAAVGNAALASGAQGRAWEQTTGLLFTSQSRDLEPDVVALNIILSAGVHTEHWLRTLGSFRDLHATRIEMDTISFNSAAGVLASGQSWTLLLQFWGLMSAGDRTVNVVSATESIYACGKMGAWESACMAYAKLAAASVRPNTISSNVLLNALEIQGLWAKALCWSTTFGSLALPSNEVSLGSLLSGYARSGRWRLAPVLLDHAARWSSMSGPSVNIAITAMSDVSNWQGGNSLLCKMLAKGLQTDPLTWTAVVSGCKAHWKIASSVLAGLECDVPGPAMNAGISVLGGGDQWLQALVLLSQLLSHFLRQTVVTQNAAVDAMARGAQWKLGFHLLASAAQEAAEVSEAAYSMAVNSCQKAEQEHGQENAILVNRSSQKTHPTNPDRHRYMHTAPEAVPFLSLNGARCALKWSSGGLLERKGEHGLTTSGFRLHVYEQLQECCIVGSSNLTEPTTQPLPCMFLVCQACGSCLSLVFACQKLSFLAFEPARHVRTYTPCLNAVHEAAPCSCDQPLTAYVFSFRVRLHVVAWHRGNQQRCLPV